MTLLVTNATVGIPVIAKRKVTPASGARQYIIKAWKDVNNGSLVAGAGGAVTALPGYISVTKAA